MKRYLTALAAIAFFLVPFAFAQETINTNIPYYVNEFPLITENFGYTSFGMPLNYDVSTLAPPLEEMNIDTNFWTFYPSLKYSFITTGNNTINSTLVNETPVNVTENANDTVTISEPRLVTVDNPIQTTYVRSSPDRTSTSTESTTSTSTGRSTICRTENGITKCTTTTF